MNTDQILKVTLNVLLRAEAHETATAVADVRRKLAELLAAQANHEAALIGFHEAAGLFKHAAPALRHDDPRLMAYRQAAERLRRAREALQ